MTLYLVVPALFLAVVLQASAMPHLRVWGVFPDLPLVLVVTWSLLQGPRGGLVWGLIAGLFVDLLSGTPAGAATLALGAVGFLAGQARRTAIRTQLLLPMLVVVASTLLYDLILLLGMQLSGRTVLWLETLGRIVLPSALLNLLLLIALYFPLRALHRRVAAQAIGW
ncbi:MAG TPA: rod shape-determining protein MreD [Anaerolineae bacterium]|nr:rod shape-determining protein MreD [Anaerolineae bacterium]